MTSPRLRSRGGFTLVELSVVSRRERIAFTLVELLVVITIIGMLAALLMPAINNAREAGRQATCINNQRQYSTALQVYLTSKEYFPGYRLTLRPNTTTAVYPSVTWQVALLPQLQRSDLFQTWQNFTTNYGNPSNQLPNRPYMEISVCPSDNTAVGRTSPWTSYVVNSGTLDFNDNTATNPSSHPAVTLPDTFLSIPMGVFQNHFYIPKTTPPFPAQPLRLSLTDIRDGQATTLILSENLDANFYAHANLTSTNQNDNSERGTSFLHWWHLPSGTPAIVNNPPSSSLILPGHPEAAINVQKGDWDMAGGWPPAYYSGTPDEKYYSARPSSNHPGGVIVSFVGGNTQFLRDDINYDVYCLLMTPAGSKFRLTWTPPPQPHGETPINEGDFK